MKPANATSIVGDATSVNGVRSRIYVQNMWEGNYELIVNFSSVCYNSFASRNEINHGQWVKFNQWVVENLIYDTCRNFIYIYIIYICLYNI